MFVFVVVYPGPHDCTLLCVPNPQQEYAFLGFQNQCSVIKKYIKKRKKIADAIITNIVKYTLKLHTPESSL